jgi:hypothetical protein
MMCSTAVCVAEARELVDASFSDKFLDNVSAEARAVMPDEWLEDVFDKLLVNVFDKLSNEVLDELVSDLLLASVGSDSSSLGLLFPSSRQRYLLCHDAFSSFNFVTNF